MKKAGGPSTSRREMSLMGLIATRSLIVAISLALWEWLPSATIVRHYSPIFDPFFVSSPSLVGTRLVDLVLARSGQPSVWPSLANTLQASLIGVLIGTFCGGLVGLILSNSQRAAQVLHPFISFMNSAPRIAFVPIFVIIAGPTLMASILTAIVVVFFLAFYNAFSGGTSVARATVDNARLLGATEREIMWQVRLPYVFVWTAASLPNAISFGLVAVVTAEILTGQPGMGRLLSTSISTVDATLTFAVVLVLSVIGAALVGLVDRVQKRALHWWQPS